ncbi:FAD-dependent monooxygenase [Corynebacterium striatum]|nr:FAD-dependent monooxygenase [Corynebacterium striatum]PIS65345.1 hypothetical protein AZH44_11555 [Corynebacterium striatum]PIS66514.1 hypothetical protein AZH46_13705 [Corynebacterium striatum]
MTTARVVETDMVIAGMGPTVLVMANLLGKQGIRVEVIDKRDRLIDYPRGVGMDDESYRTVQAMGLLDEFETFTIPHHVMRIVNGHDELIMKNGPQGRPFGHARKFGFIQPLVDNAMYEGVARYECVNATFGRELVELVDHGAGKGITATVAHVTGEDGEERTGETTVIRAKYLVGAEGVKSF